MKKGALKSLVDAHVAEAGSDNRALGYRNAANFIGDAFESGKLKPQDFSLRQVYEELVNLPASSDVKEIAEGLNSSGFQTIVSKIIYGQVMAEFNLALGDEGRLVREGDATRTREELVVGFTAGDTEPLMRRESMAYQETSFGEKNVSIFMADFGRMISLTREVIFEDKTGDLLNRAAAIGRSSGQHKAKMIIQTIEGLPRTAFEETAFKGFTYKGVSYTGAQLYNDTHVAIDGVVNDNVAATNALQDYTDIDNVMQLFANMVDEAGNKIVISPNTILVPNALKVKAYNIMNTTTYMVAGGADLSSPQPTINPIRAIGNFDVVSSLWLSSNTTWYMGDFASQLLWLNVFRPEVAAQTADSEQAFTNQILARYRFNYHAGVGHTDYRYIVKSTA